jgi:3-hydroxy-3-methylglutaryl CoA synthase
VAASAYVPRYRLPREVIAREWGGMPAPGERSVANHDEDALTMAVGAALGLPAEAGPPDAVVFGTTSAPYTEKLGAATVAAVLDLPATARTLDVGGTLRAGTSAVLAAIDQVNAGAARRVLVASGECRLGEPESAAEQSFGDAGAAVVVGAEPGMAEVLATHSVAEELMGTWRTSDQSFPRAFPGGFETKVGYQPLLVQAARGVLDKAGVAPGDLAAVVLPMPTPRAPLGVAKALGLDPKRQLQDGFWTTVGDTGAVQPLLMLAAVLERAGAGDHVLVCGYGDGADAILLRATGVRRPAAASVAQQVEVKRTLPSYGRYARFRQLVRRESGMPDVASPVATFRDRKSLLPLHGGRCPRCGVVQFPRHRSCIECGFAGGLEAVALRRRGTVFTFTHDHLFESLDPPTTHAVIGLEGGGRVYLQLTDCDADRVAIDMPRELTFRRLHDGGGFHNYFWKARPA